jgi:hypothetical protein
VTEPNDGEFERRMDEALELLGTSEADEFAKALDVLGWMIVQQDPVGSGFRRWLMNGVSNDCPVWADEYYYPESSPRAE